jgi:hypothetical protein
MRKAAIVDITNKYPHSTIDLRYRRGVPPYEMVHSSVNYVGCPDKRGIGRLAH